MASAPPLDPNARSDGRIANQVRPMQCTRSLLDRAHGSARWSQGYGAESTTVMAAVYGPKQVGGKKENAERATIEVIWKPKSGLSGITLCFPLAKSLSNVRMFIGLTVSFKVLCLASPMIMSVATLFVLTTACDSLLCYFEGPHYWKGCILGLVVETDPVLTCREFREGGRVCSTKVIGVRNFGSLTS